MFLIAYDETFQIMFAIARNGNLYNPISQSSQVHLLFKMLGTQIFQLMTLCMRCNYDFEQYIIDVQIIFISILTK